MFATGIKKSNLCLFSLSLPQKDKVLEYSADKSKAKVYAAEKNNYKPIKKFKWPVRNPIR
jgi:hypothetical protein